MSLRMFLGLQFLMVLVYTLVAPELQDIEPLTAGVILNFAVFYLAAMLVGYTVKAKPVLNAIAASFAFNAVFYLVVFLSGDTQSITMRALATDFVSTLAFSIAGSYAGLRSRPKPSDEDVVN